MSETKPQPETLRAAIETLGISYSAEFVPFSRSRNAKQNAKPSDYSLNWKITVSKGGQSLTTDYMQGIAHVPGYVQNTRWTAEEFDRLKFACERGKTARRMGIYASIGAKPIPAPSAHEVLYSLAQDASVIDSGTFEEWAKDYGYGTDSRDAERIYKACLEIALKLRAMIGESGLRALQDASQDY